MARHRYEPANETGEYEATRGEPGDSVSRRDNEGVSDAVVQVDSGPVREAKQSEELRSASDAIEQGRRVQSPGASLTGGASRVGVI